MIPVQGFVGQAVELPQFISSQRLEYRVRRRIRQVFLPQDAHYREGHVNREQMRFYVLFLSDVYRPGVHVGLHGSEAFFDVVPLASYFDDVDVVQRDAPQAASGKLVPVFLVGVSVGGDVGDVGVVPGQGSLLLYLFPRERQLRPVFRHLAVPVQDNPLDVFLAVAALRQAQPRRVLDDFLRVLHPLLDGLQHEVAAGRVELDYQSLLEAVASDYPSRFVRFPPALLVGLAVFGHAFPVGHLPSDLGVDLPAFQGLGEDVVPAGAVDLFLVAAGVQPRVGADYLSARRLLAGVDQERDQGAGLAFVAPEGDASYRIPVLVVEKAVFDDGVRPVVLLDAIGPQPLFVGVLYLEIEVGAVVEYRAVVASAHHLPAFLGEFPRQFRRQFVDQVQRIVEVVYVQVEPLDVVVVAPDVGQLAARVDDPGEAHQPQRVVERILHFPVAAEFPGPQKRLQLQVGPHLVEQQDRGVLLGAESLLFPDRLRIVDVERIRLARPFLLACLVVGDSFLDESIDVVVLPFELAQQPKVFVVPVFFLALDRISFRDIDLEVV